MGSGSLLPCPLCIHPLLQEVGSSCVHCVLIHSCRKWSPSSCIHSVPQHSHRKWVPPPMSTVYSSTPAGSGFLIPCPLRTHTAPTGNVHSCSTAPAPTVKQPPTPAQGSGLSWRSHLTPRRAPHAPHAALPQPHSTACRHHTGLPLPQAHIGPRVLCPRLLEGNDRGGDCTGNP